MRFALCLVLVVLVSINKVYSSGDVVMKFSQKFAAATDVCKNELGYADADLNELSSYWQLDRPLENRVTGCMIHCLSTKLELLDPDSNLHHGNAKEFAQSHGADADVAQQLVDIIHGCMNGSTNKGDDCVYILEVANCFKFKVHDLKWTPEFEVMIEEVLAEI